jgi:hypothetical protein
LFGGLLERCVYRKIAGSDLPDWAFTCFCKINSQYWDWLHLRCTQYPFTNQVKLCLQYVDAHSYSQSALTNSKKAQLLLPRYRLCCDGRDSPPRSALRPPPLCLTPLVQGQRRGSSPLGLSHGRRPVRSLGGAPPARAQPTDRPCETTNGEDGSHGRT